MHPIYLVLAVPLIAALWVWPLRSRLLLILRVLVLALTLVALAGLSLYLPSQHGTVVVIADRSFSLPPEAETIQTETIGMIQQGMTADDKLAVVSFGRAVAVERWPQQGKFPGFINEVGRDESNLGEAVELGLGLIPRGAPGRILVLSDGQWTGKDPIPAAVRAAERGVGIDYRVMDRLIAKDVAIARVDAPATVNRGESFLITAWVYASEPQEIAYDLRRGPDPLASGRRPLTAGLNRLTFRDKADEPGTLAYGLSIAAKEGDGIPENNNARLLVGVEGNRPLLVVTSTPDSALPGLLEAGGLHIRARSAEECKWTLEDLSNYSGVLLENVPAEKIGHVGMETLAAWVQKTGSGLMMTGGRAAYGPGGYFKSPLDPLLPVSMELRQEHRKLSLAIVVTLDRSGSMAVPVGGGRVKMDLANLGAAQVLDLMGPADEFGCIAVDSAPHVIQPLDLVKVKAPVRDKILRINSMGGGIFIYEALEASLAMLMKAKAGARHIILFSDAADAEEPKSYRDILERCKREQITVSVIGLGRESDKDGELLKDIALRGGGRCFFTDQPEELPRLFAQDTFVVARNSFLDEPTPVKTVAGLSVIANREFMPPDLGGYNLCYLRPNATLGAITLDEYKAPVVAAWQSGAGRVLCYTGEADGKYTGAMASWRDVGDFFSSLARWTVGKSGVLPDGTVITQERRKGLTSVTVYLDPDRKRDPFTTLPEVTVLRALKGRKPSSEKLRLTWTRPDLLSADVPLHGTETVLATVDVPGHGAVPLPPACLPYSPEYEPPSLRERDQAKSDDPDGKATNRWGSASLETLGKLSGGRERIELASIWRDLPRQPRLIPLAPWLLAAAVVFFLLEIFERLTGFFASGLRLRQTWSAAVETETASAGALARGTSPTIAVPQVTIPSSPPAVVVPTVAAPKPETEPGGLLEALKQVQQRKPRK